MRPDKAVTPDGYRSGGLDKGGGQMFFPLVEDSARPKNRFCGPGISALKTERQPPAGLDDLLRNLQAALLPEHLEKIAAATGIRCSAWSALGPGWAAGDALQSLRAGGNGWSENRPEAALAIPEYSGAGRLVGISLRATDGRKGFARGHLRGLSMPVDFSERVKSAACVLIVEGGSDVAAALELGLCAVGRPSAAAGVDGLAELLAGRQVLVLGEHDLKPDGRHPGKEGAVSIARGLSARWGKPVSWAMPSDDAKDLRQWLTRLRAGSLSGFSGLNPSQAGAKMLSTILKNAEAIQPPEEDVPAGLVWRAFPDDLLPKQLRRFVSSVASATGVDASYPALAGLVALGGCVGGRAVLEIQRGGFRVPAVLWGAAIGRSGTGKSPGTKPAFVPLLERERQYITEQAEGEQEHAKAVMRYQVDISSWKKDGACGDPPLEPEAPKRRRGVVQDATTEALGQVLADNPGGVLLYDDELSGFVGRLNKYSGGKSDEQFFLSAFDCGAIIVDRKGRSGPLHITGAGLSIFGTIQPGVLSRAFGDEQRQSGFLQRFMFVYPPARARKWSDEGIDPEAEAGYRMLVEALCDISMLGDEAEGFSPRVFRLSDEGRSVFRSFDERMTERAVADCDEQLAGVFSKACGTAGRLALVLHLSRHAQTGGRSGVGFPAVVEGETAEQAVALAGWFCDEAERVYRLFSETESQRLERETLAWIESRGGSVSVRDLVRSRRVQDSEQAELLLRDLSKKGHGTMTTSGGASGGASGNTSGGGGRPSLRFVLRAVPGVGELPGELPGVPGVGVDDI